MPKTKSLDSRTCFNCRKVLDLTIKTLLLCIMEERYGIVCQQSDLSPFFTLNHSKNSIQYTIKVSLQCIEQ